jgi:hypothetical protein
LRRDIENFLNKIHFTITLNIYCSDGRYRKNWRQKDPN